jgi:hypothetical protein
MRNIASMNPQNITHSEKLWQVIDIIGKYL